MAHLRVAQGSGDGGEDADLPWPAVDGAAAGLDAGAAGLDGGAVGLDGGVGSAGLGSGPWLLPVPSAWWETPAVTARALSARPEEARTARRFVREMLSCWGLDALADDAEMIVDELVVNAAVHGTSAGPAHASSPGPLSVLRLCILRRVSEVMIAVIDPGNETPAPRRPGWAGENGRGLQIVAALSHVWGWSPVAGHGKAVWAVLRDP